jgi:hypothetical protein
MKTVYKVLITLLVVTTVMTQGQEPPLVINLEELSNKTHKTSDKPPKVTYHFSPHPDHPIAPKTGPVDGQAADDSINSMSAPPPVNGQTRCNYFVFYCC